MQQIAENKCRDYGRGTKPPQSYSFGSIYKRVRTRITPQDTNQPKP